MTVTPVLNAARSTDRTPLVEANAANLPILDEHLVGSKANVTNVSTKLLTTNVAILPSVELSWHRKVLIMHPKLRLLASSSGARLELARVLQNFG
jgi:hypothetical protein